jgi:hypothetical protein
LREGEGGGAAICFPRPGGAKIQTQNIHWFSLYALFVRCAAIDGRQSGQMREMARSRFDVGQRFEAGVYGVVFLETPHVVTYNYSLGTPGEGTRPTCGLA